MSSLDHTLSLVKLLRLADMISVEYSLSPVLVAVADQNSGRAVG